jgi:predicted RNase H-like HicB family nuclease
MPNAFTGGMSLTDGAAGTIFQAVLTNRPRKMTKSPSHTLILVRAEWDDDAKVWVATSADIAGLATEAATLEELRDKVLAMVEELAELNGMHSDLPEIPVHIMAGQTARVPNPNYR